MITTPLQKIIITLFILTLMFTGISLIWFWVDTPFKGTKTCNETRGFSITPLTISGNISGDLLRGEAGNYCILTDPKELSPVHELFINLATISGVAFLLSAGFAYIQRKQRDPLKPKELD